MTEDEFHGYTRHMIALLPDLPRITAPLSTIVVLAHPQPADNGALIFRVAYGRDPNLDPL